MKSLTVYIKKRRQHKMMIRERGKRVQLIRTVYSPSKKRGLQETVGTFDRHCPRVKDIDSILLDKLTAEELDQLADWIKKRDEEATASALAWAAKLALAKIQALAAAYDPRWVSDEEIACITKALSDLKAARRLWKRSPSS
jgi:hypothetical protein